MEDGAISITVKSGFKDSFNTTSAVEKKTQEIIAALLNKQDQSVDETSITPPSFDASPVNPSRNKTKLAMSLLTFFLGGLGVHKFYAGCWGWGLVYLVSCFLLPGVSAVVALVEFIRVLTLSKESFDEKYNLTEPKPFTFIW
ncbi:TPA: TM2 domain-containing protein [Vibrio parahaemolyticus]|nr:TM2 domain-containing protein [Vibrio parahaemolyticus]